MSHFIDALINGPARYIQSHHFGSGITLCVVLGILLVEISLIYLIVIGIRTILQHGRSMLAWTLRHAGVRQTTQEYRLLQLTFPLNTQKSAFATEQLHILLSSSIMHPRILERLAGYKQSYTLELVATKDEGIRYVVRVPEAAMKVVSRTLLAYLPGLIIAPIDDYMTPLMQTKLHSGITELQLSSDYVLPLADHTLINEHDLMAYLTGHMRGLTKEELIAVQFVVTPIFSYTHSNVIRHVRRMQCRITQGKELSSALQVRPTIRSVGRELGLIPLRLIAHMLHFISDFFTMISKHEVSNPRHASEPQHRADDPYEQELKKLIKSKLDQQLFEVNIRILVASTREDAVRRRTHALVSSFQPFTTAYQSLGIFTPVSLCTIHRAQRLYDCFQNRTFSVRYLSQPMILSSSELSDLYHFPHTAVTKTEGLITSRATELPSPLSQKMGEKNFDVIVGVNPYGTNNTLIGLTLEQRQKHTYVIGKTGTGKTTLLKNSIYQDMVNGKGLAVLDPHGDMFHELLSLVPEDRKRDVVIFDPSDREHPVGLNILDPGIEFANEDDKHEWITSTVLSIFAKLTDENLWGPRMEHILRSTTLTALLLPNPSLYTVQRLLTDKTYQRAAAKAIDDPVLKQFWLKEFSSLGSMQLATAVAPLTHRLGHFITTKMSRHILLQPTSGLRMAEIMDQGKILLVNLSKGDIGEDQSSFFGTMLTSMIWMAAYQRTKIPENQRRDFFVYIDEFQNFATPRFSEITSEGRKFHVSLILSHQNVAQIKDTSILKIVAGNANTIISLNASPVDENFILPFMKPEVEKGDIVNLEPYHFYMKAMGKKSESAFSGKTVPFTKEESDTIRAAVIAFSRERYSTPKAIVEAYLINLLTTSGKPKKDPDQTVAISKSNSEHSAGQEL